MATAPAAVSNPTTDPRKIMRRVIVNRQNVAEQNQDLEIVVNDISDDVKGCVRFIPGYEVELTQTQIEILKNACTRTQIDVDGNSGIYDAENPKQAAKQYYPGFIPHMDVTSGIITMVKERPNYSISPVDGKPI